MDRVGSLPNEVLSHILSFLPTKEAALTSVLAKRWRNLFAFVPNLHIDDSIFLHPEEGKRNRAEIIQSFTDFVDRVLALQGDSPINKFSIKCISAVDRDRVDGWISNVLARGVSDLDLYIILDACNNYRLSPKCFESKKLVKLKIGIGTDIGWLAGSMLLPMLKILVLDTVGFYVDDKFEILLRALPVLEELVLVDVLWEDFDPTVSNASLKTLTIKGNECTFSFDTPSLVYFYYDGYVTEDYPIVNMKNLVDAQIIFSLTEDELKRAREPDDGWFDDVDAMGYVNVWKFFHGIQNVSYLELYPDTLEVLSLCSESMPVFNNLKVLCIKSAQDRGWQAMPVLLRNCPHLETLVLEGLLHYVTDKCGDACDCVSRDEKGRSLASCPVKMLEIQGFRGTMREIKMIKHFLDYFPCLMEMEIYVAEDALTLLRDPEVSEHIAPIMELFNKISKCNVHFVLS